MLNQAELRKWLASRPPVVRALAERYPPNTPYNIHGVTMYVISYTEGGAVLVTPVDPAEDYEQAIAQRQPVCRCCLPELDAHRIQPQP